MQDESEPRDSARSASPTCVIANTVKGRGVSFMEDVAKWHHGVPSADEYERAVDELGRAEAALAETVP
jgi:transketolase